MMDTDDPTGYIEFIIDGDPVAWMQPRILHRPNVGRNVAIKPTKMREYQDQVKKIAKDVMGDREPISGPVELSLVFYFQLPKSKGSQSKDRSRWKPEQWKLTKPDLSNLIKCVEDAMSGIIYLDDNQVVLTSAAKRYCAQGYPGFTSITITEVDL